MRHLTVLTGSGISFFHRGNGIVPKTHYQFLNIHTWFCKYVVLHICIFIQAREKTSQHWHTDLGIHHLVCVCVCLLMFGSMNGSPLLPSVVKPLLRRSFWIQTNCKLKLSEAHSWDDPQARGHVSVPGSTQSPVYSLYTSSIISLSFSPTLSFIHQQSCTPLHPHGDKWNKHTYVHTSTHAHFVLRSPVFPDKGFVIFEH